MSYFAQIDAAGIVLQVIAADRSFIAAGHVGDPSQWIETSEVGLFRKRFASTGYTYDVQRDAFITPRPGPEWTLDELTLEWMIPSPASLRTFRSTLVQRLDDEEARKLETVLQAEEPKLRLMFYAVDYFQHDDPLYAYMHFVIATALSEDGVAPNFDRANHLLAPS